MLNSVVYLKTNGGTAVRVYPIYGTDVALSRERESNQRYLRNKIEGTFTFVGTEYGTLYNGSIDNKYTLQVYIQNTLTGAETLFGEASFVKTDCEFDIDSHTCTLKLGVMDEYTTLLGGLDNEYNLVALAPERKTVSMYKRPILQLYFLGDKKLTNVVGNISYEINCAEVTDTDSLEDDYHFHPVSPGGPTRKLTFSEVSPTLQQYSEYLSDSYSSDFTTDVPPASNFHFYNDDHSHIIKATFQSTVSGGSYICRFVDASDNLIPGLSAYFVYLRRDQMGDAQLRSMLQDDNRNKYADAYVSYNRIYVRLMFDVDDGAVAPSGSFSRPAEDICETNLNYRYVYPIATINGTSIASFLYQSTNADLQDAPTEYGLNGRGRYFKKPSAIYDGERTMPVAWNMWIPTSFWYRSTLANAQYLDNQYKSSFTTRDAYPLASAIQVLLTEIAGKDSNGNPYITFGESATFSQFLYSATNPIDSGMNGIGLYITPITNVKKTYYEQAAQKGPMKLSQIFDMLRKCYQCYWFLEKIDDSHSRLRIEHIQFFKNGNNYGADARTVVKNLNTEYAPRNGKPWAFGQNKVKYDISSLPNRFEFGWANNCTEPFEGYAIDVTNQFLEGGSTESVKVDNFVSDIDYIVATPDSVGDDYYALICANASRQVVISSYNIGGSGSGDVPVLMQNPQASFLYLEQKMYDRNMPASSYKINGYYFGAVGTVRAKIQEDVEFPCTIAIATSMGLIYTGIGSGEIRKISLNLSSLMAKATLEYDTI